MGQPEPLRVESVLAYAGAFGFADTPTDLEEFCDIMELLDRIVLNDAAARQQQAEAMRSARIGNA